MAPCRPRRLPHFAARWLIVVCCFFVRFHDPGEGGGGLRPPGATATRKKILDGHFRGLCLRRRRPAAGPNGHHPKEAAGARGRVRRGRWVPSEGPTTSGREIAISDLWSKTGSRERSPGPRAAATPRMARKEVALMACGLGRARQRRAATTEAAKVRSTDIMAAISSIVSPLPGISSSVRPLAQIALVESFMTLKGRSTRARFS